MASILAFYCSFTTTSADITLSIERPTQQRVYGDVRVSVRIQSTFEITNVVAKVNDRESTLTFITLGLGQQPVFAGDLSLEGLARGAYELSIIATDAFGNTGTATKPIFLDRLPTLQIGEPLNAAVAVIRTPLLPVDISCEDDGGGCSVQIYFPFTTRLTYTNGVLDLSAYDHSSFDLLIYAIEDSTGSFFAPTGIRVHVEFSPRLLPYDHAPGNIIDFDEERLLFLGDNKSLHILDRDTRETTLVASNSVEYGYLTPRGAVYVRQPADVTTAELVEFPGASLGSAGSVIAKGPYVIWNKSSTLYRRNVVTEQTEILSNQAGNWRNDLTADGDVAFWSSNLETVFLNGEPVSTPNSGVNVYPLTDGTNVVWRRTISSSTRTDHFIVLYDGNNEIILTKTLPGEPEPHSDYQIAGGWVAYRDLGTSGQYQVWKRSPFGVKTQLTFFGSSSYIEALSPEGHVLWRNGSSPISPKFLDFRPLGSFIGQTVHRDGQWHVVLGNQLFLLNTEIPLSIELRGNSVLIYGTGTLLTSTDLQQWTEIGPIDGSASVPTEGETVQFFRLAE